MRASVERAAARCRPPAGTPRRPRNPSSALWAPRYDRKASCQRSMRCPTCCANPGPSGGRPVPKREWAPYTDRRGRGRSSRAGLKIGPPAAGLSVVLCAGRAKTERAPLTPPAINSGCACDGYWPSAAGRGTGSYVSYCYTVCYALKQPIRSRRRCRPPKKAKIHRGGRGGPRRREEGSGFRKRPASELWVAGSESRFHRDEDPVLFLTDQPWRCPEPP